MQLAGARRNQVVFSVAFLVLASLTSTCVLWWHLCQYPPVTIDNPERANNNLDIHGLNLLQTGITLSRSKIDTASSGSSRTDSIGSGSTGITSGGSGEVVSARMGVVATEAATVAVTTLQQPPQSESAQLLPPFSEPQLDLHPLPPALLSSSWSPLKHTSDKPAKQIHSAEDLLGVKKNSSGDLRSLLQGLVFNCIAMFFIIVAFWFLPMRYPRIYVNNVLEGKAPGEVPGMLFGWAAASWRTKTDQAVACAGLDQALLVEFCDVAMKMLSRIALPTAVVLCPLHFFLGGNRALAQGDHLSRIAMGNVVRPHPWILYVHAFFVWMVVLTTQGIIHETMQRFLVRRAQWLKELPFPQASTVLVEGIPQPYRSDAKLREFFALCFEPSAIKTAHVVKDTGKLIDLHRNTLLLQENLCKAKAEWANNAHLAAEFRPQIRKHVLGERCDAIDTYTKEIEQHEQLIKELRQEVIQASQQDVGGINTRNGFVTFASRREAELAVNLQYSNISVEWQVSYAPEPEGVDWDDLMQNVGPRLNALRIAGGYAVVMALYLAFLPVCIATTNLAYMIHLGPLQNLWMAIAPSLSLTIFMSFLPTVMINTFDRFFILKSKTWCQLKLQHWYFWFQVLFVILVTAIGQNFFAFVRQVASEPPSIFLLLGRAMPEATHFYMSYIILQCTLQVWGLIRSAQLGKFLAATAIFTEEEAHDLAEPEDQDYFGIGSRSARATIVLLIGIIFCTLSPMVAVLSLAFFFVARLVYGYLTVFAETRKPDLGGAFFVLQLQHVQVGLSIYSILMTGVLYSMAPTIYPSAIAAPSLLYTLLSAKRFNEEYLWEKLPFGELISEKSLSARDTQQEYVQPELVEVVDDEGDDSLVRKMSSRRIINKH